MSSMLERLMAKKPTSPPRSSSSLKRPAPEDSPFRPPRQPAPYEIPDPKGTSWLLALPEELLERLFIYVDRVTFVKCLRVCSQISTFLNSNSSMKLHNLLQTSSLVLNPNAVKPDPDHPLVNPPSRLDLLDTLRERITRLRNLTPKAEVAINFEESEGRLYEYLEGVLIRSIPTGTRRIGDEIAIYDFRKMGEWEDVYGDKTDSQSVDVEEVEIVDVKEEEEFGSIRRTHKFGFQMLDFAFDPGMDLFVVAEHIYPNLARGGNQEVTIHIHLLSLTTFEPHPRAKDPILKWPGRLPPASSSRAPSLGFQICDEGLFVLANNSRGTRDMLCGWDWTSGRLAVTLAAPSTSTFESFVLLTPSSFAVPSVSTSLRNDSTVMDDITNFRDLVFAHHLHIYAFPPLSATKDSESHEPLIATHVTTIDLPKFKVDFDNGLAPPRMIIRADPPPRRTFPVFPVGTPQKFVPSPESGVFVLEFQCEPAPVDEQKPVHYVMFIRKKTLLAYLPAPTSPLLFQQFSRPAPVVPFVDIAAKVRLMGPSMIQQAWVCYVYQDRFVTLSTTPTDNEPPFLYQTYDFDPLRVRQAMLDPCIALSDHISDLDEPLYEVISGEVTLKTRPQDPISALDEEVVTGSELPFVRSTLDLEGSDDVSTLIIDGERIIAFEDSDPFGNTLAKTRMHVLEF